VSVPASRPFSGDQRGSDKHSSGKSFTIFRQHLNGFGCSAEELRVRETLKALPHDRILDNVVHYT